MINGSTDDNVFMNLAMMTMSSHVPNPPQGDAPQPERTLIPCDKLNIPNDVIKRTQMQGIPDDDVDVLKLVFV